MICIGLGRFLSFQTVKDGIILDIPKENGMNKKRLRVAKKSPMFEKKVIFGIRKFTVGVASVGIATAFLISGTGQLVQAEEVATPSTEIRLFVNCSG